MITLHILIAVYLLGCAAAFLRLAWLCGGPVDAFFAAMFAGGVFDWPFTLVRRLAGRKFGGH